MDFPAEVITLKPHSIPAKSFKIHTKLVSALVVCVRSGVWLPAIAVSVYSDDGGHVGMWMRSVGQGGIE